MVTTRPEDNESPELDDQHEGSLSVFSFLSSFLSFFLLLDDSIL